MKHTEYLKKKKRRESRKRIISILAAFVVFVATYALVLPALTLDVNTARMEPGMSVQQSADPEAVSAPESSEVEEAEPEEEKSVEAEEPADEEKPEKEEASSVEEESAKDEEAAKEEQVSEGQADSAAAQQEESDKKEDQDDAAAANTDAAAESLDQTGSDAAAENAETAAVDEADAFKAPDLEAIDFDEILTDKTDFYYYHADKDEDKDAAAISSTDIDDWKKVKDDTVLAPEDFVRVYLAYTIPAGALNETNAVARYRLPDGLELTDKQIKAINKNENGISGKDKDAADYKKYLGAEAIEGTRTPDKTRSDDEYISATVKVEKVYKDDKYVGQDLVFTFAPYTVQKNQISYDDKGNVKSEGKAVKGWFSFDLTPSRIAFEETEDAAAESGLVRSEAKITFVKENNKKDIDEISRALTLDAPAGAVADKDQEEAEQAAEQKTLTYEGSDYTVIINYTDDAEIPDNATLEVSEIGKDTPEYNNYLEQAKAAVKEDKEEKTVNEARFFDITILADGEKVEPAAPVNVQINFAGIEQTKAEDAQLLHYTDDDVQIMDKAEFGKSEESENDAKTVDTVQFETDGFSVYGIVGTETITTQFITADGETYTITVTYGPEAGIPKDAVLEVSEITEGEPGYEEYVARTDTVLGIEEVYFRTVRLFDIKIVDSEGNKVTIAAPVSVKIQLKDEAVAESEEDSTQVVHFADENASGDVIEKVRVEEDQVYFEAEGFSVYSVVSSGATTNLNGRTFAIINTYNMTAVQGTNLNNNNRLSKIPVALNSDEQQKVRTLGETAISKWTFTSAGNNTYYIQNESGQYLNIGNDYVRVSDTQQAISIATSNNRLGMVRLYRTVYNTQYAINDLNNGDLSSGFGPYNDNGNNEWFRLYDLSMIEDDAITIHYVDESGNVLAPSKRIEDTTKVADAANYTDSYRFGDIYDLYLPIGGHAYKSTHLDNLNGTQINAEVVFNTADSYNSHNDNPSGLDQFIQKASFRWEYQESGLGDPRYPTQYDLKPFADSHQHVYVVYREGEETIPSHGGGGTSPSGETLEKPQPEKNVVPNGDGTYEMSLSVNASSKPIAKTHGANIVVVFDVSASMTSTIPDGRTRLRAARDAAIEFGTRLLALNQGRENDPLVEIKVIPFNSTPHNESAANYSQGGTTYVSDGWYRVAGNTEASNTNVNTFNGFINNGGDSGMGGTAAGTNWERAIKRAQVVAEEKYQEDGQDTYVIFLTDGNPWVGDSYGSMPHTHDATGGNYMQMGAYFYTAEPAREIVKAGHEIYGLGMYGNVDVLHYLMNFAYTGRSSYDPSGGDSYGHYFPAQEQESLVRALSNIAGTIEGNLAMAGVDFKDGIAISTTTKPDTTMTALKNSTVSVGGVDVPILTGITYSKGKGTATDSETITVKVGPDKRPMFSINGGTQTEGSIVLKSYNKIKEDASETESATAYVYQLVSGGKTYEMPIASLNSEGDLDWDLSPLETLESGATYTLTTTIWPDQEAYDLVTDLNNGEAEWDDTAATRKYDDEGHWLFDQGGASKDGVTYEHIVKYPDGSYAALSNTYQTLDYYVVEREGDTYYYTKGPQIKMPYPDPMGLTDDEIDLVKEWEKSMMPGAVVPSSVKVDLLRDDEPFISDIELTEAGDWKTSKYIAPGLMISVAKAEERGISGEVVNYDGGTDNYVILNTGYDYRFTEDYQRVFQLEEKVYHPMLVNSVLKNVVITVGDDGKKTVTPTDDDMSQGLIARNILKGGINIDKVVQDPWGNVIDDSTEIFDVDVTMTVPVVDGELDFSNVDRYLSKTGQVLDYSVAWYAYYWPNTNNRLYDSDLIELGILEDTGEVDSGGYPIGVGVNHPFDEFENYGSGWFMIDFDDETGVAQGTVKIIPGYTLRFSNMAAGTTYDATETEESAAGHIVSYYFSHQAYKDGQPDGDPVTDEGDTHTVVVNQGNNIEITNKQTKSALTIIKADEQGNPITSENDTAEFKLVRNTKDDGTGTWINAVDKDTQKIENGKVTVNSTEGVTLEGLVNGLYQLTETKAPNGYIIITDPVTFRLKEGAIQFVIITTEEPEGGGDPVTTVKDIDPPSGYSITPKTDTVPAAMTINNTPGAALPYTGGSGTFLYTLSGIALIMASALMYGFRMRRRERRLN